MKLLLNIDGNPEAKMSNFVMPPRVVENGLMDGWR